MPDQRLNGIIVLDGHDCAGKTTLKDNLLRANGGGISIHCTYRFKERMFDYHMAVLRRACRLSQNNLVILDRFWLSEDIYAYVYRGGSKWPLAGRIYDRILMKHATLNIICCTDPAFAEAKYAEMKQKREEMYDDNRQGLICQKYSQVIFGNGNARTPHGYGSFLSGAVDRLEYDYACFDYRNTKGPDDMSFAHRFLDKLEKLRKAQGPHLLQNTVRNISGSVSESVAVLVGDKVNHPDYKKCWPFSGYSASSLFITKALHEAGVPETHLLWTNASCEEDHLYWLKSQQKDCRRRFVALGNEASNRLNEVGIEHTKVLHPAAAARFGGNVALYGYELKKAIYAR